MSKIDFRKVVFPLVFTLAFSSWAVADHHEHADEHGHASHHEEKGFQPGPFIFDHILDSHDWHIVTFRDKHVSIPLPVILFSEHSGFHVFLSSKFEHGHASYNGFSLPHDGEHKGKVIETLKDGSVYLPLDFSITKTVLAIFFSCILLLWMFLTISRNYKESFNKAPRGLQNLLEVFIIFIRDDVAKPAIGGQMINSKTGERKYEKYMPFLLTTFFFIAINNLLGLVPIFPGGANVTGNIAVTLVLALFTFVITTINGNRYYWEHIFSPPGIPIALYPLMIIVEILGVFIKPFVLMVRLFANITAGHVVALGFFSLIFIFGNMSLGAGYGVSILSVAFSVFMTMLEFLVAFIQAYVFTLLSALYFGMATEKPVH